ncbi:restriction endonuclease subunit S [Marinifilum fragile]|uniref:restriction endonuclease subunit S n=1 Tax=Marinifilum fragile TaxID=570161 RepID=UPI002AA7B47C|nr:restriction endonuclease subunit S [Marinifilum fragile]
MSCKSGESNYKRLGDFIKRVSIKNENNKIDLLLGINIDKFFMPSVANTVGTDLSRYKVVSKNQFACNRMHVGRDKRLPISLSQEDYNFLVSPAYDVFEIKNLNELLPEYLMMWFRREEFDRRCWFHTDADVRGKLDWEALIDFQLPIPSIQEQKAIVDEYSTVVNRIKLNEQLNQKLEETAQALYKHWFVDFEFPNDEGKPYKSSGGKMVYCEELEKEIPEGWDVGNIESICDLIDGDRGKNYPSQEDFSNSGHCLFLNAGNVTKSGFNFSTTSFITKTKDELLRKGKLVRKDIVLTTRGTVGNIAYFSDEIEYSELRINSGMILIRAKNLAHTLYIYSWMRSDEMKQHIVNYMSGSAQPQLPIKDIKKIPVLIPENLLISKFSNININIQKNIDLKLKENRILLKQLELQLSQMTQSTKVTSA